MKYSHTNKSSLEYGHRLQNIEEELLHLDGDVVCLQEVDVDSPLLKRLIAHGYDYAYA